MSKVHATVPFRAHSTQNFSTTVNTTVATTISLAPANLGARAASMCIAYEWWRIKSLVVESFTNFGVPFATDGFCGLHMATYDSDYFSTAPSTVTGAVQSQKLAFGGPRERVKFRLSAKEMSGAIPGGWRHTTATGSPNSDLLYAGIVTFLAQTGAVNFAGGGPLQVVLLTGVLEFKDPAAPTLSLIREPLSERKDQTSTKDPPEPEYEVVQVVRKK